MLTAERKLVAEKKLEAARKNLTADAIKGILIETPNNIWTPKFMTLQSAIFEYDGKSVTFHVSAGYDPHRGWNTYSFD